MATATGGNKRPRRSTGGASPEGPSLADLPDVALSHAAEYLPPTARALWAVALTASAAAWEGRQWQLPLSTAGAAVGPPEAPTELDFADVERECREKLSDGELGGVLVCLRAGEHLESLKLPHCFGVTGAGLAPLRASTALKQIDLSLVKQDENPAIAPEPPIAASVVIPILDSIIGAQGSSLVHIQLPKKWREEKSRVLREFLLRYNRYKNEQSVVCAWAGNHDEPYYSSTDDEDGAYEVDDGRRRADREAVRLSRLCRGSSEEPWVHLGHESSSGNPHGDLFGIQRMTCCECMKEFCLGCCQDLLSFCNNDCERVYCEDCRRVDCCYYRECGKYSCNHCAKLRHCRLCMYDFCPDCDPTMHCDCDDFSCSGQCSAPLSNKCAGRDCHVFYYSIGNWPNTALCKNCQDEYADLFHSCQACRRRFCHDCLARERNKDLVESCPDCAKAADDLWL